MTAEELKISINISAETAQEAVEQMQDVMHKLGAETEALNEKTKENASANAKNAEAVAKVNEKAEKLGGSMDELKDKTQETTAANAAFAAAAAAAFSTIIGAVNKSVQALNSYQSAMRGLQSVSGGRGIGQDEMQRALDGVTDAFFSATAAASAYKNLLTRGYSLDQATNTINRLKDAAAFGRNASLSLEAAVTSATEGIKNENSVLVDNAGVTKNVAKMWEDYADARGLVAANLTQQQKVEAEYLGIMAETQLQVGDLAKASQTLAGSQAEQAAQVTKLATAYGSALEPGMKAVTEIGTQFLKAATGIVETLPGMTSGLTTAALGFTGLVAVLKTAKLAQDAFNAATASNPYLLGTAIAVGAIGLIAGAVSSFAEAQERAQEAERKRVAQSAQESQELMSLAYEYDRLTSKASLNADEQIRVLEIEGQIADKTGNAVSALDSRAEGYQSAAAAAMEYARAQRESFAMEKRFEIQVAMDALSGSQLGWIKAYREDVQEQLAELQTELDRGLEEVVVKEKGWFSPAETAWALMSEGTRAGIKRQMDDLCDAYDKEAFESFSELAKLTAQYMNYAISDGMGGSADKMGQLISETYLRAFESAKFSEGVDKAAFVSAEFENALVQALSGIDAKKLQDTYNAKIAEIMGENGQLDPGAEEEKYAALIQEIMAQADTMIEPFLALMETLGISREELAGIRDLMIETSDDTARVGTNMVTALKAADAEAEAAADSVSELTTVLDNTQKNLKQMKNDLNWKREALESTRAMEQAVTALNEGSEVTAEWAKAIENARIQYGAMNTIDLQSTLGKQVEAQTAEVDALENSLNLAIRDAITLLADIEGGAYGEITLDNQQAMAAIAELIAALQASGLSIEDISSTTKKKGGGGGGKSKAEQRAEEARRAQEDAYNEQIRLLEHRKKLDQLTLREEIEGLERIKREYARTADQIRDIDERIYAARKALRDEQEEQIAEYHDALTKALRARYEAQYDAERKRLDESIDAWNKWSDETCAAIQAQIDALDDKAEAEDREAVAAQKKREIDKIDQQMRYETDEYNLRQLEKQLARAQQDWADTQKMWARADQREALEDQMDAARSQADAQIEALEREGDALTEWYAQITDAQRLSQEAQTMILRDGQEDMLALLRGYAPEYKAAGEDIGAALFDGFANRFGNITKFFEDLTSALLSPLADAARAGDGTQADAAGRKVEIVQNVNFNQPVETPSETARRMWQVNEALAEMV